MWVILMLSFFDLVILFLLLVLLALRFIDKVRFDRAMGRVEKLLDLTERHGALTESQKNRVERVVSDASVKAVEVAKDAAKATKEEADDIKKYVDEKMQAFGLVLRREFTNKFEHMEALIKDLARPEPRR